MKTRSSIAPLRSLSFVLSILPALAACPAGGGEGDDEIGDSDSTDESDGSTDSGESDSGDSDSTDESSPETDSTTDESSDTGEPDPDTALCQQYCEASYSCNNDGPLDPCVATCLEDLHAQPAGMCLDNEVVLLACLATLTCEEYEAYLWHEEGQSFPCDGENDASCECTEAAAETSWGNTPSDCALDYACVGETDYALECSDAGCVCFVDGVETGGCAEPTPICEELLGDGFTFETVNDCCGWSLG